MGVRGVIPVVGVSFVILKAFNSLLLITAYPQVAIKLLLPSTDRFVV